MKIFQILEIQVQDVLVRKHGFSYVDAIKATESFLISFRKCPENPEFILHEWRQLLWKNSLGETHKKISGDVYSQWLNFRYEYLSPDADVVLLLKTLRETYNLVLMTNGPSNSQWEKIKMLKLNDYFDLILVSGDLKFEKPDERIFLKACCHFGVSEKECIIVGDKLETDILGGIRARLGGTVWLPLPDFVYNSDTINIVPDCIIYDFKELKYYLGLS